jgi:hypothetical protein
VAGLASWLLLVNITHHARAFAHPMAPAAVVYIGGRPEMIHQLQLLKRSVEGDARKQDAPMWLRSADWEVNKTKPAQFSLKPSG